MAFVIIDTCIKDGACAEVCPVTCIHSTPDAKQFYIDPDICIECEQCVVVCPVDAVYLDVDLPEEYEAAEEDNAAFFRQTKEPVKQLTYGQALEMIHGAEDYARRMGHKISVAIVDGIGAPIAIHRMDGANPRTSELALNKAYTATLYTLNTDTARLAHRSLTVASRGKIMAGAGGIGIMGDFGAVTLGGIGVDGGANNDANILCSQAGLAVLMSESHH